MRPARIAAKPFRRRLAAPPSEGLPQTMTAAAQPHPQQTLAHAIRFLSIDAIVKAQ